MVRVVVFSQCPGRPREDFLISPPQLQLPPSMPMGFLAPRLALPRRKRHHTRRERHRPRRERHLRPKLHLVLAKSTTTKAAEAAEVAAEAEDCLLVWQGFPCLPSSFFCFTRDVLAEDGLSSNCPARKWAAGLKHGGRAGWERQQGCTRCCASRTGFDLRGNVQAANMSAQVACRKDADHAQAMFKLVFA